MATRTVILHNLKEAKAAVTLGLILFTENLSGILVFDSPRNNYNIIGDGEMAYSRYIGGRSFIKKWIERNS